MNAALAAAPAMGLGADGEEGPLGPDAHVVIVRWPEEAAVLDRLRARGTPRLLVVPADMPAPRASACDEDWIRMPATDDDMRARIHAVASRSSRHAVAPVTKGDGRIVFRDRWAPLGEIEEAVASMLAARFGEVVDGAALAGAVEPPLSSNAVRTHIMRLRSRLKPLGLGLRTVRSRGYVLEPAEAR